MDPEFRAKRNAYRRSEVGKAVERRYAISEKGRAARRASNRRWIQSESGRLSRRRAKLLSKYGLSLEQWDSMLIQQAGRCGCCGLPLTGPQDPCVDHDHATGTLRDLLCNGCNLWVGVLEWNDGIQNGIRDLAIAYVRRWKSSR